MLTQKRGRQLNVFNPKLEIKAKSKIVVDAKSAPLISWDLHFSVFYIFKTLHGTERSPIFASLVGGCYRLRIVVWMFRRIKLNPLLK